MFDMSKAFWFTAFTSCALTSVAIYYWADNSTDAGIMFTIWLWATFLIAILDVIRTTPRPPTPRNP